MRAWSYILRLVIIAMGISVMRTASLFKNGNNQAVRLPKEFEFKGVTQVGIIKEGESIVLTPKRKSWTSLIEVESADADFLVDRSDLLDETKIEW